jgi:hypothetical protein
LAVKAALLHLEKDENFLRNKVGHNLANAIPVLVDQGLIDRDIMEENIGKLPDFVKSRYDEKQWDRNELVSISLAAQRILGEVCRTISGNSYGNMIERT